MSGFNLPPGVSVNDEHINPGPDDLELAEEQLAMALEAHQAGKPVVAFERMHNAVNSLLRAMCALNDRLDQTDATAVRSANVASCLANGINPD